jgi:hypothetical protein
LKYLPVWIPDIPKTRDSMPLESQSSCITALEIVPKTNTMAETTAIHRHPFNCSKGGASDIHPAIETKKCIHPWKTNAELNKRHGWLPKLNWSRFPNNSCMKGNPSIDANTTETKHKLAMTKVTQDFAIPEGMRWAEMRLTIGKDVLWTG